MLKRAAILEAEEEQKVPSILKLSTESDIARKKEVMHMENVCQMFKILDKQ